MRGHSVGASLREHPNYYAARRALVQKPRGGDGGGWLQDAELVATTSTGARTRQVPIQSSSALTVFATCLQ